jgi:GNAT superfamily N-acetyltransferase
MSEPRFRLANREDLHQLIELRVLMQKEVYTLPEWRGRGIAGELMKLLVEHARSRQAEKLHLGATELGQGVYERVGFRAPSFMSLELRF